MLKFGPKSLERINGVELQALYLTRQARKLGAEDGEIVMGLQRAVRVVLNDLGEQERQMLIKQVLVPFLEGEYVPPTNELIRVN